MLTFNIQYQSKDDLAKAKSSLSAERSKNLLIQVFCGEPAAHYVETLLEELRGFFPEASILGTTTAGEIFNGKSLDRTVILSFCQFDKTTIQTALLTQNDDLLAGGYELASGLHKQDLGVAILFGCGIRNGGAINGEPLLEGFQRACPDTVVVGGQAGDNGVAQQTFVFTEEGYTDKGAACAALYGADLKIDNRYNLSWVPLGRKMTITEADGTSIKTIDNRPAKNVYSHYLGENVGERLPHSAAEYPLVVERNGVLLARHANRVTEDGSLDFMAPFYAGERVQFAFCHTDLVANSAKKLYLDLQEKRHQAIFIYSCLSRKWVLGADADLEIAPLASLAPTAGFFSYGEYYNNEKENMFLSQTMTVLALSEGTATEDQPVTAPSQPEYNFEENKTKAAHDLQALHQLVETSAREREDLIKELKVALAEIKTLRGFIPICANCKNIRDDKGYWNQIEDYISSHTEAQFSHGLCPGCAKDLYPEIYDELDEEYRIKNVRPEDN